MFIELYIHFRVYLIRLSYRTNSDLSQLLGIGHGRTEDKSVTEQVSEIENLSQAPFFRK